MDKNIEKVRVSPRDFFLHLGIIVALYVSVISLINLLFQVIDYAVGDKLGYTYDFYSTGLRIAMASLIIFFPAYLILGWIFQRDLRASPEKHTFGVRRWLVYLTLFIAGLTIVIDLSALINNFLGGEITTSFAFKVLAVLVVAGLTFTYYFLDIRRNVDSHKKLYQVFASAATIVVIASIVGAFVVVGSPATMRVKRLDQQRVYDLMTLQSNVTEYWRSTNALPKTLADLNNNSILPGYTEPRDPATGAEYEYQQLSKLSYEVCATFNRSNKADRSTLPPSVRAPYASSEWLHDAGRTCYSQTINPATDSIRTKVSPAPIN